MSTGLVADNFGKTCKQNPGWSQLLVQINKTMISKSVKTIQHLKNRAGNVDIALEVCGLLFYL